MARSPRWIGLWRWANSATPVPPGPLTEPTDLGLTPQSGSPTFPFGRSSEGCLARTGFPRFHGKRSCAAKSFAIRPETGDDSPGGQSRFRGQGKPRLDFWQKQDKRRNPCCYPRTRRKSLGDLFSRRQAEWVRSAARDQNLSWATPRGSIWQRCLE